MRQLYTFLCLVILSVCSPTVPANFETSLFDLGEEFFYPLENGESIPWGIVTDITQDKRGFIWIGTQNGLLRFDGYDYKVFKHDPNNSNSSAGDSIYSILAASDGRLWFSTEGGVSIFDPNVQQFSKLDLMSVGGLHPVSREARAIVEQGQYIWLGTESGLIRVDQRSLEVLEIGRPTSHLAVNVRALVYDGGDWLWVGGANGVNRINVDSLVNEPMVADFEYEIASLLLTSSNSLWVGTDSRGLYAFDLDRGYRALRARRIVSPVGTALGKLHRPTQPRVSNMIQVGSDEVWLAVSKSGVLVFDSQSGSFKKQLRTDALLSHSISANSVVEMFIDRSGLMWVGTLGKGIDLHNTQNHAFKILSLDSARTKEFGSTFRVLSLLEQPNGTLWLTGRLFVLRLTPGSENPLELQQGLMDKLAQFDSMTSGAGIAGISLLPDGDLLFVMSRGSILRYNIGTETLNLISTAAKNECVSLRAPSLAYDEFVWIPCRYSGKLIRLNLDKNSLSYLHSKVEGGALLQGAILLDRSNTLWVSTKKGLFKVLNATSEKTKLVPAGLQSQLVVGLLLDSTDRLWVDTYQGLYWKDVYDLEAKFSSLGDLSTLSKDQTFGNMLEGQAGRIWGDEGVFDPVAQHFEKFQLADGFEIGPNWLGAHLATRDGLLLFSADDRLLMIQTKNYQPWQYVPPLVITRQLIDGESLSANNSKSIVVLPKNKSFSIDVSALDYSAPMNNKYRHRLLGFDERWVDSDAKHRRISYTNLTPGDYVIEIVGSNRTGRVGGSQLKFNVEVFPAWYQTVWFKVLLAILACLLIYGLIYIRSRQLRIRQVQL